ncbi:MAG: MTH938/NDUFAF3 family protein [Chloroflexota bacterium]|nr:MTH938/NDUFAF3 family protein [Chloroflexota bacterium]
MSTPQIESYRFGRIVIDGRVYGKDVIILPDRVIGNWWRQEGHALRPDDLEAVFEAAPEVLVVGQGDYGLMRVTGEAAQSLQAAGIELIALPTGEAVETYNRLCAERAVAAALHLTC